MRFDWTLECQPAIVVRIPMLRLREVAQAEVDHLRRRSELARFLTN